MSLKITNCTNGEGMVEAGGGGGDDNKTHGEVFIRKISLESSCQINYFKMWVRLYKRQQKCVSSFVKFRRF